MEIGSYLRARPWGVVIALLFPVLAGLVAYGLLRGEPNTNTASANVRVPESVGGSASIGIFVADFGLAAESAEVLEPVSEETGVGVGRIRNNLDVERLGQSSRLTVSYTDRDPARAEQVLRVFIRTALVDLTADETAITEVRTAEAARNKAVSAQRNFENTNGANPDRQYNNATDTVQELQAAGTGGAPLARALAERDRFLEQRREYDALTAAAEASQEALDGARQRAAASTAATAAAQDPSTVEDLTVEEISSTPRLVQGVTVAAILGALCGLAVLVLPDLIRPGRRREPAVEAEAPARRVL